MKRAIVVWMVFVAAGGLAGVAAAEGLGECLDATNLPRIARVLDPGGRIVYARVTQHDDGHITHASTVAAASAL